MRRQIRKTEPEVLLSLSLSSEGKVSSSGIKPARRK
jgi:hypothetical protein